MTKMISFGPGMAAVTYKCPNVEVPDRLWKASSDRLLRQLDILCGRQANPHTQRPYQDVRKQFWALNMVLNNNGEIAPRFRPTITVGKPPYSDEEKIVTNDKQVLDLHWLSVQEGRNGRSAPVVPKWKQLFEDELDLDAAAVFVKTVGKTDNKVDDLMLSPAEELKLQVIQSQAVRKYWQRTRPKRDNLKAALLHEAVRNRQLHGKEAVWADAWLAGELSDYAGGSGPDWYRLMTGQKIPPSSLSRIRKMLKLNPRLKSVTSR